MKKFVDHVSYASIDYMKIVYVKNGTWLYSSASNYADIVDYLEKGQTGEVLSEEGDYYFVRTFDGIEGYIRKGDTTNLTGLSVVIDLSTQKIAVYENNSIILKGNVVTGKDSSPTRTGKFKVEAKKEDYALYGPPDDYYEVMVNWWMQYDGNYGMHDKKMNGRYGGNVYHKDGSHGCVRMSVQVADKVYHLVRVGTPVIIHN